MNKILHKKTGAILFEYEGELRHANFSGVDLRGAEF